MNKKSYIQPSTDLMDLKQMRLCDDLTVGSNGDAVSGKWGVPVQKFHGEIEPIKKIYI